MRRKLLQASALGRASEAQCSRARLPQRKLAFATIWFSDNDFDRVSNLDRSGGAFRVNIGVRKETFASLFRESAADLDSYDFTQCDKLMPHPHYAAQHFIGVVSPGEKTSEQVKVRLADAYELQRERYERAAASNND